MKKKWGEEKTKSHHERAEMGTKSCPNQDAISKLKALEEKISFFK